MKKIWSIKKRSKLVDLWANFIMMRLRTMMQFIYFESDKLNIATSYHDRIKIEASAVCYFERKKWYS